MPTLGEEDVKKLLDYFVYAPIGVISSLADSIPKAVENGRQVVEARGMAAKFMGKMAVDFAGGALKSQLDDAKENVGGKVVSVLPEPWNDLARFVLGIEDKPQAESAKSSSTPTNDEPKVKVSVEDEAVENVVVVADVEEALAPEEAEESLQEGAYSGIEGIIPSYGTLSANQIVAKLDRLSAAQLREVLDFENAHRGRKTIVNRVSDLLEASK
ncbi:MAG: hypothetical protein M0019_07055 [Actinomycetota bacterium]|nr:hypothetical protein [Actinomycetota bacterium]